MFQNICDDCSLPTNLKQLRVTAMNRYDICVLMDICSFVSLP